MRAKFIYESIEFERGIEPNEAMGIGIMALFKNSVKELRDNHPRSEHTEFYINKIKELLEGSVDEVRRSIFTLDQAYWGLNWVDDLVKKGVIKRI